MERVCPLEHSLPSQHPSAGEVASSRVRGTLDPRVAVVAVFLIDGLLLAVGTEAIEIAGTGIAVLCLALRRRWAGAVIIMAVQLVIVGFIHGWFSAFVAPASTLLVFALTFTFRFVIAGVIAACLIGTLTTGQLQALLAWARIPRIFAVPIMVALRFLPVVVDDMKTVSENLVMRGVFTSRLAMLLHPILTLRYAVLTIVASSLRAGDELSASALLRGLGSTSRPTTVVSLRLNAVDVLAMLIVFAFVALVILEVM